MCLISAADEFQNKDFCFHAFGPSRNITRHRAANIGAKVFVNMKYSQFSFMWYSFHIFGPFRKLTRHRVAAADAKVFVCTVRLKWIETLSVDMYLPRHYRSILAHLSYLYSLIIGLKKSKRWAKNIQKWRNIFIFTKFANF